MTEPRLLKDKSYKPLVYKDRDRYTFYLYCSLIISDIHYLHPFTVCTTLVTMGNTPAPAAVVVPTIIANLTVSETYTAVRTLL